MKKTFLLLFIFFYLTTPFVFANDTAISKALDFLRAKQDTNGKIITGFSAPSEWAAIAFMTNDIDAATVKKADISLADFLLTDIPTNDTATDWETRILAIVAIHGDPTNFNGTNYVQHLQSFYTNGQIGDMCSLNDDIFGFLALVASGNTSSTLIKQDILNFLISKQDSLDGGFGFSAPGCNWYSTSADMTGAGLQALVVAKDTGLTNSNLDDAINKAKNYLLTNQESDGGFGYFGSSDTDTTGWVLIGLNAAGMGSSEQAIKAKTYLLSQQSDTDGGFMAFDYGLNRFVSNTTTTAQAIIGLSGKTWILQIFTLQASSSAQITPFSTPTPMVTTTPSFTPSPTPSNMTSISQQTILYKTITITATPPLKKIQKTTNTTDIKTEQVLGQSQRVTPTQLPENNQSKTVTVLGTAAKNPGFLAVGLGSFFLTLYFVFRAKQRKILKSEF